MPITNETPVAPIAVAPIAVVINDHASYITNLYISLLSTTGKNCKPVRQQRYTKLFYDSFEDLECTAISANALLRCDSYLLATMKQVKRTFDRFLPFMKNNLSLKKLLGVLHASAASQAQVPVEFTVNPHQGEPI